MAILEAQIQGALQETFEGGIIGTNPGSGGDEGSAIHTAKPVFGMEIHYFDGNGKLEAPGRFNGNISWIKWQAFGETPHAYGFKYDDNNRLEQAIYGEQSEPDGCTIVKTDKYTVRGIGYDELGNIQGLTRRGLLNPDDLIDHQYDVIDALEYVYTTSPNRVNSVIDTEELELGFKGGTGNYDYDVTGNMTYLSNKALNMEYAFHDLPVEMNTPKGKIINYYTSTGIKLKSVLIPIESQNDGPIITNYFQNIEYENSDLKAIYFEEGRATFDKDADEPEDQKYIEYFLKDHLGNTRVRIADKNGDDRVKFDINNPQEDEMMSIHHYYPFGMEWDTPNFDVNGNSLTGSGVKTKYTYNGKELVDDLDINLHDYGARYYDAAIARWTSVDPLADVPHSVAMNPYHFVANNPIANVDPDGLDWYRNNYSGQMLWQNGSDQIDGYTNVGAIYEHENKDGSIIVFKQQFIYRRFNSLDEYDGSYLRPSSAYDYDYDGDEGKYADDANYANQGEEGSFYSRWWEVLERDLNEDRNQQNVDAAKIAFFSQFYRRGAKNNTSNSLGA